MENFWNVAGLRKKDEKFWKGLGRWEVMVMVETWVDSKEWEKVKGKLPKGYKWGVQWAKRVSRKERAMGGMIMGIRRKLWNKGEGIDVSKEGLIVGRIKEGRRS